MDKERLELPSPAQIYDKRKEVGCIDIESGMQIRVNGNVYDLKAVETGGKQDKYYSEMPIQIKAIGGYHQLGTFITKLEQEKRVIVIDDVQIRYNKNNPRLHDIEMMVKTYVSMEDQKNK